MIDTLKDIFSNINDWLKFAEEKNAALIALNLVSIFGATAAITQKDVTIPKFISYYLYSFIILNGLGLTIALYSFWPQTQIEDTFRKKIEDLSFKKSEHGNSVLFYGHIKDYTPQSYLDKLRESCNKEVGECSGLVSDYASQIVINSRIASRKYRYFKAALFCTISALLTPMVSIQLAFLIKTANCLIMKQYRNFLIYLIMFIISFVIIWKLCVILWNVST
jgi:CRISPR/Cas system CMR-associated protein Cmr5 small subunit